MDEEPVSLHELLFSCYRDNLKLFTKYYLDSNIINRRKDTVFLIHSLVFVSRATKVQMKKIKWTEEV